MAGGGHTSLTYLTQTLPRRLSLHPSLCVSILASSQWGGGVGGGVCRSHSGLFPGESQAESSGAPAQGVFCVRKSFESLPVQL